MPSFDDDLAFAIMEEELGKSLGEVFSSISEHPIAAASLGQVSPVTFWNLGLDHCPKYGVRLRSGRSSIGGTVASIIMVTQCCQ